MSTTPVSNDPQKPDSPLSGERSANDDPHFRDALSTLERNLKQMQGVGDKERDALRDELDGLRAMQDKLARGRIEIVVFGEISTGKSALINALAGVQLTSVNVQGGWTKEIGKHEWGTAGYTVPGLAGSSIHLVDTPGLNEVGIDGRDRATMACETARYADVILFVTDSDLNEIEYSALLALASVHKPILLVLNKIDLYSKTERERLVQILRDERLAKIVPAENFVLTAANPREVEYVVELPGGETESKWKQPPPDVGQLKARLLEVLEKDGLSLLALNAAMYAADNSDRIASLRIKLREKEAQTTIWSYSAIKAIIVGLTPLTFVDVAGGMASDILLVVALSRIYGLNMSWMHARGLVQAIMSAAGWSLAVTTAVHFMASAMKLMTFGFSTALSSIPQGAAAGYGGYIVGQAAKHYFEHGSSWGGESAKVVVQRILAETDRDSVLEHLRDEIRKRIRTNRHADGK